MSRTKREIIAAINKVLEDMTKANLLNLLEDLTEPAEEIVVKTKLNAEPYGLKLEAKGNAVDFGRVPRDVYSALSEKANQYGGRYDRQTKTLKFEDAKKAKQFAKLTTITAEERNLVRASWGWK